MGLTPDWIIHKGAFDVFKLEVIIHLLWYKWNWYDIPGQSIDSREPQYSKAPWRVIPKQFEQAICVSYFLKLYSPIHQGFLFAVWDFCTRCGFLLRYKIYFLLLLICLMDLSASNGEMSIHQRLAGSMHKQQDCPQHPRTGFIWQNWSWAQEEQQLIWLSYHPQPRFQGTGNLPRGGPVLR